jgi:hypothetical protein
LKGWIKPKSPGVFLTSAADSLRRIIKENIMKNVTIAKQLQIALSIGVACSAHAQLLGRGGAVGGMIGGAGNFGGQLSGMGNIGGNGALLDRSRSATSIINTDEVRGNRNAGKASSSNAESVTPTPAAPAAKQGSLLGGVTGSGNGSGNAQASANADSGGIEQVAGSALQGARSTAAPVRDGAKAQADNTRSYAQSSVATASDAAKGSKQAATSAARFTSDAATAVQPSFNAGGSASGNGSANGETKSATTSNGSQSK